MPSPSPSRCALALCLLALFAPALVLGANFWRPVLPAQERTQLDSASDFEGPQDAGALYPLLRNVLSWDQQPPRPDYLELRLHPERYRGQLFTFTGQFGQARDGARLARQGPWGERLREWIVEVEPARMEGERLVPQVVAIVLIVDPEGRVPTPANGDALVMPARFYRMHRSSVRDSDRMVDFPVFVAAPGLSPDATGTSVGAGAAPWAARGPDTTWLIGLVLMVFALFWGVRVWARRSSAADVADPRVILARRHAARAAEAKKAKEGDGEGDDQPPLPADPIEAMEVLRRHKEQEESK